MQNTSNTPQLWKGIILIDFLVMLNRTSVLRSSQNSLQSSITGPQRPASAYYPPSSVSNPPRSNLHQSIPNLKSPPATQRLQNDDTRSGSYPSVNYSSNYVPNTGYNERQNPNYVGQQGYGGYPRPHEEVNNKYNSPYGNSYPSPTHSAQSYPHVHTNGHQRPENFGRPHDVHHNQGLLREDIFRHSQTGRSEEMMRYPSSNNVRIAEAQIQHSRPQQQQHEDLSRQNDMRISKSEDMLRQYNSHGDGMMRYASSGNVRAQESSKIDLASLRHGDHISNRIGVDERTQILKEEARQGSVRQAKLAEMSEEVARRQNRMYSGMYQQQQVSEIDFH